jgi:hypothetical protein
VELIVSSSIIGVELAKINREATYREVSGDNHSSSTVTNDFLQDHIEEHS